MTNGIDGLKGYGNFGVGGYIPNRRNNDVAKQEEQQPQTQQNYEETQVDPSKVMDFLSQNNFFVKETKTTEVNPLDNATQDRIGGYMEQFEMIYGVIQEEFGEEFAPLVMDMVMDKLMGLAA